MLDNAEKLAGRPYGSWESTAKVLSCLVAIFIVIYLPAIAGFSISIDDEHAAYRTDPSIWVAQGRWLSYLIELLFFRQSVAPYFPDLIFGLGASVGYIVFLRSIGRRVLALPEIMLFSIFIGFPVWFFLAEFYSNLAAAGVGLALTCLSAAGAAANLRNGAGAALRGALGGATALAAAIACYQSYLFFFFAAGLALILVQLEADRNVRSAGRLFFQLILVGVLGGVIYYLLWRLFMRILHIQPAYIQSFISFDALLSSPVMVLRRTFDEIGKVYGGSALVYMQPARSFAVLIILAYVAVIHAFRRSGVLMIVLGCAIFSALLLLPFSLNPFSYGAVPYRSLVGAALAAWFAAYVTVKWSPVRVVPYAWGVIAVVALQSIYTLSLSQAATTLVSEHDRLLALQIHERIVAVNGDGAIGKPKVVEFYGARPFVSAYPKIVSSTAGYSFFEWDGGNTYRIVRYMNLLGFGDVEAVDSRLRSALIPYLWAMPLWPAQGSVKVVHGVTLVKLGAQPGEAQLALTEAAPFVPKGRDLFYDSASDNFAHVAVSGKYGVRNGRLEIAAQPDPQIFLQLNADSMRSCRKLQIHVEQQIGAPSVLQIFYSPDGQSGFQERYSEMHAEPSGLHTSNFFLSSAQGFGEKIRIDPVSGGQNSEIQLIKVGCLEARQPPQE